MSGKTQIKEIKNTPMPMFPRKNPGIHKISQKTNVTPAWTLVLCQTLSQTIYLIFKRKGFCVVTLASLGILFKEVVRSRTA